MTPGDSRLDALQHYAEGSATREEVAAIERAIVEEVEFRQFAVEYLHLDSALEEFGTVEETRPVGRPIPRAVWVLAAAAAIVVMGCSLRFWWPAKPSMSQVVAAPVKAGPAIIAPPEVAQVEVEVLQLLDAQIAGPNGGLHAGDRVRMSALELRSGEVQLRLASDVKLVMAGPSELRFRDAMHVQVLRGKVTVDCGVRGKGFILDTPVTRVVDVSTQFGVEARADGATDVLVIEGSVDLVNPQDRQRATPLDQGEAVRVDARQALTRIVRVTGGRQPTEWSTQPPPDDCSIVSVGDNFGTGGGYYFHRIVPHGARPGAAAYTDTRHFWQAAEGREFPATLLNADLVQTVRGEIGRRDFAVEVEVARPVELFVLMPQRGTPWEWLTENFTRTGEEISLEESGSPTRARLAVDVWKRTVPQAGKVTLGPPNRDANGRPAGMYGIAAKPLTP